MIKKEIMPFKKFSEAHCGVYREETKRIKGVFKEIPSGKIIKGDNFKAHLVGNRSAEEVYKAYLMWFNHTREIGELEREFVSAEFEKEELKIDEVTGNGMYNVVEERK